MHPQVWRRRTRCVYCGVRITGVFARSDEPADHAERRRLRRAARFACRAHLRLTFNDPGLPTWNMSA